MPVGVIDVGANTVRLLVAELHDGSVGRLREERIQLGLGEEIESTGGVSAQGLERLEAAGRRVARDARREGCERIEVLVTSPGRQSANADELIAALAAGCRLPVRVLSAEEEARLAWIGAIDGDDARSVAVCDVGGGSTQIVVGTPLDGPAWARSFDIGSLRLTGRFLDEDPPTVAATARAAAEVERVLGRPALPLPQTALATGGTARALRRVAGPVLGASELDDALETLIRLTRRRISGDYGVDAARARTLVGGAIILAAVQERLGVPFEVARGGIREGAARLLLSEPAVASA